MTKLIAARTSMIWSFPPYVRRSTRTPRLPAYDGRDRVRLFAGRHMDTDKAKWILIVCVGVTGVFIFAVMFGLMPTEFYDYVENFSWSWFDWASGKDD